MHQVGSELYSDGWWQKLEPWERQFDGRVAELEHELIAIRRHLHAHPEPSGEELETSKFVAERLRKAGVDAWIARSDTDNHVGVVADFEVGRPATNSPLIAVRCDLDALRIPDEKQIDYASRIPGVAHACGHDAHTAILLGVALTAAASDSEAFSSSVVDGMRLRFLFQPAEETSQGAQWLADQGAMENVDAILGLHVDPERAAGTVGIRYGALTANCDEIEIEIDGHGGHAARPHHSTDPIAAAAHLISTLYEFLPRSVDSRNAAVLTIGKIAGGYAPNVIPERVELCGTLRTTDDLTREILKKRLQEICRAVEQTSGTQIGVRFLKPLKSVENHSRIASALEQAAKRIIGPEKTSRIEQTSLGGEDFSVYLEHAPGALLRLGCGVAGTKSPFLHSSVFDIDEQAIAIGARIMLWTALILTANYQASANEGKGTDLK